MEIKGIAIFAVIALLWFIFKPFIVGIIKSLIGLIGELFRLIGGLFGLIGGLFGLMGGRTQTQTGNLSLKLKFDNINLQKNTFDIFDIKTRLKVNYSTISIANFDGTQEAQKVVQTKCISKDSTDMVQLETESGDFYAYSKFAKFEYSLLENNLIIFCKKSKTPSV